MSAFESAQSWTTKQTHNLLRTFICRRHHNFSEFIRCSRKCHPFLFGELQASFGLHPSHYSGNPIPSLWRLGCELQPSRRDRDAAGWQQFWSDPKLLKQSYQSYETHMHEWLSETKLQWWYRIEQIHVGEVVIWIVNLITRNGVKTIFKVSYRPFPPEIVTGERTAQYRSREELKAACFGMTDLRPSFQIPRSYQTPAARVMWPLDAEASPINKSFAHMRSKPGPTPLMTATTHDLTPSRMNWTRK